jgi:DNA-binding transcriptional regulator of glucitol operon
LGLIVRWRAVLRPRWLAWHAFAVVAFAGMLWLGDWQLHRALSGNELSWAYTFEWPLFAIFGVYFWAKSVRDELRSTPGADKTHQGRNEAESSAAPLTADEYVAHLKAEVSGHGRWHGWR